MVRPIGVEPIAFWSVAKRSIQLSYERIYKWWLRVESNHRHRDFQSLALPTELQSHKKWRSRRGLNPRSSAWQADVVTTALRDHIWLREKDLNLRPLGYEPNELPDCSIPRYKIWRRKRDSNPCAACATSRFSRPIPSTGLGYSSNKMVPKVGLEPTRVLKLAGF